MKPIYILYAFLLLVAIPFAYIIVVISGDSLSKHLSPQPLLAFLTIESAIFGLLLLIIFILGLRAVYKTIFDEKNTNARSRKIWSIVAGTYGVLWSFIFLTSSLVASTIKNVSHIISHM